MDIIAICGSPREGNTEFAIRRFLEKAEKAGHGSRLALLREKDIKHCRGCMACDAGENCPISDDMRPMLDEMESCDLIIFGSPNYDNNVTGMMKDFFDRMNPLYKRKTLAGKKMASICVGGSSNESYPGKMLSIMGSVADLFHMDYADNLYLVARGPHDAESSPENIQKIDEFAKNIFS